MNNQRPFPNLDIRRPTRRRMTASWLYVLELLSFLPPGIERLLRSKILLGNLNRQDRICIVSHLYLNMVEPQRIIESLWLNPNCTEHKIRRCVAFYSILWPNTPEAIRLRARYYAFNVTLGRISDLNGHVSARERTMYIGI